MNRFKAEQVVDVFQMIKSMRSQHPAVVQTTVSASLLIDNIPYLFTQEQYEFIHQVVIILTKRYETYANFTVL